METHGIEFGEIARGGYQVEDGVTRKENKVDRLAVRTSRGRSQEGESGIDSIVEG